MLPARWGRAVLPPPGRKHISHKTEKVLVMASAYSLDLFQFRTLKKWPGVSSVARGQEWGWCTGQQAPSPPVRGLESTVSSQMSYGWSPTAKISFHGTCPLIHPNFFLLDFMLLILVRSFFHSELTLTVKSSPNPNVKPNHNPAILDCYFMVSRVSRFREKKFGWINEQVPILR